VSNTPPEGQDQPPPPGQYQPPPPYQPPPGGYTPPPPPGVYTPPPGGYPPPPPPGGYAPPPGGYAPPSAGGFGSPQAGAPLAEWPQRAVGLLIDWGIGIGIGVVAGIIAAIVGVASDALFVLFRILGGLVSLGWAVWLAVQIGQTGQSPGMRVAGLKAIRKDTGAPLGVGMAVVRWLSHLVFWILCFIPELLNFLWPLWDSEKQMLSDKVVNAVVIVVPKQSFSLQPPTQQSY
jgi:uncharacterized RDD family membrane protein YckC